MIFCNNNNRPGGLEALHQSACARVCIVPRFLLVLCAGALCGVLVSCGSKTDTPLPSQAPETNAVPAAAVVSPELAKLVGKWERPDGGYILEIKSVDASGKLEAGYYNPDPINVARAAALRDKGTNKVFVELRDANYPGCTYTLTHDPQSDQLYGQYYQAAMQQTFDVVFARVK
jgi:hypothetical protein